MNKTNVMRLLDAAKLPYEAREYTYDENDLSGLHAAEGIGAPPEQIFKTLVARGEKQGYLVFCIPVCCELDLKKAAKAAHDKKIELIHVKDLLAATGGIVQGMSGSPILQDGRIVGAVTHVLLNDPTRGYGIFLENMLSMAG